MNGSKLNQIQQSSFHLCLQAGVDGQQILPDSFQLARATGSETLQSVYINRELDLDVWQLADKVTLPDKIISGPQPDMLPANSPQVHRHIVMAIVALWADSPP